MSYSTHIKLKPVAPYNFELNARIFTEGDHQISGYDNGKFWQVINVNNILSLIIVKSSGTVEEPELSIELKSDRKLTDEDLKLAENIIISMFNLDFDS